MPWRFWQFASTRQFWMEAASTWLTLQEDPHSSIYNNRQQMSLPGSCFQPACRPKVGDGGLGIPERAGRDSDKAPGALRNIGWGPKGPAIRCQRQAKASAKEEREGRGKRSKQKLHGARCRGDTASKSAVSSPKEPESNPLRGSMSFTTWAICLPRWILQSRSDFAWHLRRSFCFSARQSKSLPTTAFPLPLPVLPACVGSQPVQEEASEALQSPSVACDYLCTQSCAPWSLPYL